MLAERRRPVGEGRGIRESHGEDIEDTEGDGKVPVALPVVQATLPSTLTLIVLLAVHVANGEEDANSVGDTSLLLFTRDEESGYVDCDGLSLP